MQAFRDINILPSHNKRTAIVAWLVDPSIKTAAFYIYRKYDGGAEWELLNETPVYGNTYADKDFFIKNKEQVPAYKVLALTEDNKEYVSPEVALFSRTGRKAYGVAQNIIRAKYYQARQDGIPVLYYPAITNGAMSASLDDVTGQRLEASCTASEGDEVDYGTYYKGGYYRPFLTYVRLIGERIQREDRLDDGIYDTSLYNVEFLAFPPVRTGDLVVDVATDRRWFVGSSIKMEAVQSIIPVSYTATLSLQEHNHPCYAVPIPTNYHDMLRRLTWPLH